MGDITISVEEYKRLLETSIRTDIFADYVNGQKYSIERKKCGEYLGFNVKNKED